MEQNKKLQHIVLADDDKDHGVLFKRILHKIDSSLKLSLVYDGEELLQFLHTHDADLIFLDLKMPCKSGHECLAEIKRDSQLHDLPVIVYSSSSHMTDIQKSFIHKADIYMVKPFHSDHLKQALESVISLNWKEDSPMNRHYFINNRFVPFTATG